ncbi:hypothetical protein QMG83_14605 [Salinibacterium sp. G-O1]|uniref:hypothetical protein n=1 Tax=Salinibacterium sp. G-O1 TaxID=3046208 RepID=UPI0024BB8BA3|nr:hypothetical protein [Salinibacterium sp. G-O1]MDJ0336455.1 hypothetical protein [Salinibacterium sp. G-O1]
MSSDSIIEPRGNLSFLRKHVEVIIAVLLGLISIATAYASFQSSLYDGNMTQAYTTGSNLSTEAESLYLEGNQQYVQDAQLLDRLTDLQLDMANPDPAIADAAQIKYDLIYFQSVSEDFDRAITAADALNESDPDLYYSPLDDEDYQASLFGTYAETKDQAVASIADGDKANTLSDKLTLATVVMAISLFLLGIAAVVGAFRIKLIMGSIAVVIFVLAAALTATIPPLTIG